MLYISRFLFFIILVFLSSCNVFKPYKSVESEPRVKVTIKKATATSQFDVIVFVPDNKCYFEFMGRVLLKKSELERIIYMPPGRSYFRVFMKEQGYYSPGLKDISFVLKDNEDYTIEYQRGGYDSKGKLLFSINYLETTDGKNIPVDADHFNICEREKGLPFK